MKTKLIGVKEFRQNMSKIAKKYRNKNVRFIVMSHTVPLFEAKPVDEDELTDELLLEFYKKDIEEALEQAKRGEVFTSEEVRRHLGLSR